MADQSSKQHRRYVIISPCRDEAEFMLHTLDSVVAQSEQPALWLIVDDGSTDKTPEILAEYESKYNFIQVFKRENRGFRSVGPGVVDAFYSGYKEIDTENFDYICKLDLDLELPPKYFEILMDRMEANPRLGTCSGKPYNRINGNLISERRGDEMSVGMTKFFRMTCFKQIGGFVRQVMWDAIDCHKARQMGWVARSWDEPKLRFIHLRLMGSSQHGIYTGRQRHGFGQFFMGTGPIYMLASSVFRMLERPYVLGGIAMYWGYLKCYFNNSPRLEDKELTSFIRRFQWRSLLKGKKRAMEEFEIEQESSWNPQTPILPMPVDGSAS
jgi:glycosyltransferase involved in cell wall biosynthesis